MKLPDKVRELMNYATNNGYEIYLIGGAVRDMLLGIELSEYDFTINALPLELLELFSSYGRIDQHQLSLGCIKVYHDNDCYEITCMRKETGVIDVRYPKILSFCRQLQDDVNRRDFTINQIAIDREGRIVDYLKGLNDLNNHLIKVIGDPSLRFKEDPLRILRALRFSLKLNFIIDSVTYDAMINDASNINNLKDVKYLELFKIFDLLNDYSFINKHLTIFKTAFLELDSFKWDKIASGIIDSNYLKYYFIISCGMSNESINNILGKDEKKIYFTIVDILNCDDYTDLSLKIMLGKYGNRLISYLKLVMVFKDADLSNQIKKVNNYLDNKIPLVIKDLKINGNDLLALGIKKERIGQILNYLLEKVLEDETLNNKDTLVSLALKF